MNNEIRVGSAVILENEKGEILLIKRKYNPAKGRWVLPGGGIKFGENSKETAKRELKEETGLDISIGNCIGVFELIKPEENVHRIIFYHKARVLDGTLKLSDDADDAIWIKPGKINSIEKLGELTPEVLKRGGYL